MVVNRKNYDSEEDWNVSASFAIVKEEFDLNEGEELWHEKS